MSALFTDILEENILHILVRETANGNQALEGMNYLGDKLIFTWYILQSYYKRNRHFPRFIEIKVLLI
jgi:hypothetical protein